MNCQPVREKPDSAMHIDEPAGQRRSPTAFPNLEGSETHHAESEVRRRWDVCGDWGQDGKKAWGVKKGDPRRGESGGEVRGSIRAKRRRNGRGAKGVRKVDAR